MRSIIFGTRRRFGPKSTRWLSVGTVDDVLRRAQVPANQLRLVLVKGPFEVGREEAVHHVHPGREAQLGDAPQDKRLVGGLLSVLAEHDDPPRIERAVHIVVSAMDVEGVLGERAGGNFQHHRGALAGSMVVLLDAVDDALARGVVHDPFSADGVGDGAALSRVLALGLHGYRILAEDVELAFGERLLVQLTALGRWCDGIEDASIGDARLGVVRNQLVPVGSDTNPWVRWLVLHHALAPNGQAPRKG